MKAFLAKIAIALKDPAMRKRIGFTIGALIVFRLLAAIPMPGIDADSLGRLLSGNQFLGLLDIFSGGTLVNFSVMAFGLNEFIKASIIFQKTSVVVPRFEQLAKDGE